MRKLEVCVLCGFCHRDDRNGVLANVPHYHWHYEGDDGAYTTPEIIPLGVAHEPVLVVPTVCATHFAIGYLLWRQFADARAQTPNYFKSAGRHANARLPDSNVPGFGGDARRALDLAFDSLLSFLRAEAGVRHGR
jgi:hypothetical protein